MNDAMFWHLIDASQNDAMKAKGEPDDPLQIQPPKGDAARRRPTRAAPEVDEDGAARPRHHRGGVVVGDCTDVIQRVAASHAVGRERVGMADG